MRLHLYRSINHTIYIWRGTISAVYFMYKSRAFKLELENKLEKLWTENAQIHKHNNKNKVIRLRKKKKPIEYSVSKHIPSLHSPPPPKALYKLFLFTNSRSRGLAHICPLVYCATSFCISTFSILNLSVTLVDVRYLF